MANLEFCDKHNMVAYLKKPTGSEGFQEIVDFLNGSHIRFALTKNLTIYVSLIEKFWQTTTVRTIDNGEQEITATVDGKKFTITEASVRTHLQLADVEEPIPNIVSSSHQKTQKPRQALNQVIKLPQTSEPIPNVLDKAVYKEWDDIVERATTTAARLDAAQASGNIIKTQSTEIPNVPLPQGISAGGSPSKLESLEEVLKQTKQVYGAAYTKLITKVKKLEKIVKTRQARRRAKIMVSDDKEELEDSSKQGRMIEEIDQDVGVTLVTPTHSQEDQHEDQLGVFSAAKVLADEAKNVYTYTRRRRAVSTGSGRVSTASRLFSTDEESVSTAGASMPVSTAGMVQEVNKDKGKGIMTESEPKQTKKKL
ncbi:hypothetical protein Tco_0335316 [Tanacetum coccineum]